MNVTERLNQRVVVSGQGNTKESAISSALADVQKQIIKENAKVVLRIEPKSINVLSAEQKSYTEKFLFFFLPRVKSEFKVTLEVEVELTEIVVDNIGFNQINTTVPNKVNIPFLSKSKSL